MTVIRLIAAALRRFRRALAGMGRDPLAERIQSISTAVLQLHEEQRAIHQALTRLEGRLAEQQENDRERLDDIRHVVFQSNECLSQINHFLIHRFEELMSNLEADARLIADSFAQQDSAQSGRKTAAS